MKSEHIVYILSIIVIVTLISIRVYKVCKTNEPLKKLSAILSEGAIINHITDIILDEITKTDFSKYESIGDAQAYLLNEIYDKVWCYLKKEIFDRFGNDKLYITICKLLTLDIVQDQTIKLFMDKKVQDTLLTAYQKQIDDNLENTLREQQEMMEEAEKYNNGDDKSEPVPDLDPTRINGVVDEEGEKSYNPPTDDGSPIDDDVDEVVDSEPLDWDNLDWVTDHGEE